MIIECKRCSKPFKAKPSAVKRGKKYCSKECYDLDQFKGEVKTCHTCGAEIRVSPSLVRERNFCTNECRRNWLSEYVIREMNVKGHSKGHRAVHLTRLNIIRNPKLALEPDVFLRGEYKTYQHRKKMEEIMGRKLMPGEEVHHINGIHDDNSPENLVVMRKSEHLKLHWRLAKERGVI